MGTAIRLLGYLGAMAFVILAVVESQLDLWLAAVIVLAFSVGVGWYFFYGFKRDSGPKI